MVTTATGRQRVPAGQATLRHPGAAPEVTGQTDATPTERPTVTTPVMSSLAMAASPAGTGRRYARLAERERARMRRRLRTVAIVAMTIGLSACAADEVPDLDVPSVDVPDVDLPDVDLPEFDAPDLSALADDLRDELDAAEGTLDRLVVEIEGAGISGMTATGVEAAVASTFAALDQARTAAEDAADEAGAQAGESLADARTELEGAREQLSDAIDATDGSLRSELEALRQQIDDLLQRLQTT